MPEYLNFASPLSQLNEDEANEQLTEQIQRMLEVIERLDKNDRIDPKVLEEVVSV
jgi:hypothetical protein